MPRKKLTAHHRQEAMKMQALAFSDAVRDILSCDGVFNLGDDTRRDTVWQWDGVRWTRVPLAELPGEPPPLVERERDGELATAG